MLDFWNHFDWGGFLGAILGAVAAGLGVIYSLRKTAEFDRQMDERRKDAVRRIVLVQAKLSLSNVYHTTLCLVFFEPPKNTTPFKWWRRSEPQMYVMYPSAVSANLGNISLLVDREIEITLQFHQSMIEYCQSLEKCKNSKEEEDFPVNFDHFLVKRRQIVEALLELFQVMGPLEKIGDQLALKTFERLAGPLPEFWKPVLVSARET